MPALPDLGKVIEAAPPPGGQFSGVGKTLAGISPARLLASIRTAKTANGNVLRGKAATGVLDTYGASVVLVVTQDTLGSGTIVGADGLILSTWQAVRDQASVGIIFKPGGAERPRESDAVKGRVVATDRLRDLSLISIEKVPAGTRIVGISTAPAKRSGTTLHLIGHPYGEVWMQTPGTLTRAKSGHSWKSRDGSHHRANVIEVTTPVMSGNLGGPILGGDGRLVAVDAFSTGSFPITSVGVTSDEILKFMATRPSRKASAAGKSSGNCEPVRLETRRARRDTATAHVMDLNCNGKADAWVLIPDASSQPVTLASDANENGLTDSVYTDQNRDGKFDDVKFDTDEDGNADLLGFDLDQELTPQRIELP
jgi:hypothetical protein